MSNANVEQFKLACRQYLLANVDIGGLRAYARSVGVHEPTKLKQQQLIDKIIAIHCGELAPVERSNRGAPLKNDYFEPSVAQTIDDLRAQYLQAVKEPPFADRYAQFAKENKSGYKLVFKENDETEYVEWKDQQLKGTIYRGQLQMFNGLAVLLPLNCVDNGEKVLVSTQLIHEFDLREGDVVSCEVQKGTQATVATKVLTVNDLSVGTFTRNNFETAEVCYPNKKMQLYTPATANVVLGKYIDWLLPMYKGQRCLIRALPKTGKTALTYQLADTVLKAKAASKTFVLLNGQLPEVISQFRKKFPSEDLLFTSYDDEPEKQVFVAEYILKRAKQYAETGCDVVLFIDSLNALANAYNETKESSGGKMLACGLESKTVQFLKKYFGTARAFEKGGSLTICATVCVGTGNAADDVIGNELSAIANYQLTLDERLAKARVYPAVQLLQSYTSEEGLLSCNGAAVFSTAVSNEFLPKNGEKTLLRMLDETDEFARFEHLIKTALKN